jgi:hypothetical protein
MALGISFYYFKLFSGLGCGPQNVGRKLTISIINHIIRFDLGMQFRIKQLICGCSREQLDESRNNALPFRRR